MQLNTIKPAAGAKKARRRVGRGIGSGLGKTAGRGHKGQSSRSGGFHKVGFEGGQMPLQRRLPKRGFNSLARGLTAEVRLSDLQKMQLADIDLKALKEAGVVPEATEAVKVILSGKLERKVSLSGLRVTKGARAAIEAAGGSIAARAAGYGIPGVAVDGNDALAVHAAVAEAVRRARGGDGPSLIEAKTVRWLGHHEGDPQAYRPKSEVEEGRRQDPIARLRAHLEGAALLDAAHAARVAQAIEADVEDAIAFAESSPLPEPHHALDDLFVHWPWKD